MSRLSRAPSVSSTSQSERANGSGGLEPKRKPQGRRCYPDVVKALKAHVHKGQIVLDEPVELPEGAAVEVLLPESDDLTAEEHRELEHAVEQSAAEFARGEFEDARAFARRLVAKS